MRGKFFIKTLTSNKSLDINLGSLYGWEVLSSLYAFSIFLSLLTMAANALILGVLAHSRGLRKLSVSGVMRHLAAADGLNGAAYLYINSFNLLFLLFSKSAAQPRRTCLFYTFPQIFTLFLTSLFTLSVAFERVLALGLPIFYRSHRRLAERTLIGGPWLLSFLATAPIILVIRDTRSQETIPLCSSAAALNQPYLTFLAVGFVTVLILTIIAYSVVLVIVEHRRFSLCRGGRNRAMRAFLQRHARVNAVITTVVGEGQ